MSSPRRTSAWSVRPAGPWSIRTRPTVPPAAQRWRRTRRQAARMRRIQRIPTDRSRLIKPAEAGDLSLRSSFLPGNTKTSVRKAEFQKVRAKFCAIRRKSGILYAAERFFVPGIPRSERLPTHPQGYLRWWIRRPPGTLCFYHSPQETGNKNKAKKEQRRKNHDL